MGTKYETPGSTPRAKARGSRGQLAKWAAMLAVMALVVQLLVPVLAGTVTTTPLAPVAHAQTDPGTAGTETTSDPTQADTTDQGSATADTTDTTPVDTPDTAPPADTTPPVVTVPADITVTATDSNGATVSYQVTATDDVDGGIAPTCVDGNGNSVPADGVTFPVGTYTITCTATDSAGNISQPASFTITVNPAPDTEAPVIAPHDNIVVDATDASGATVTYDLPTATDNVDGAVQVTCAPASGTVFPVGDTTVTCSAQDAAGNAATATFTVTVNAPAPSPSPSPALVQYDGPPSIASDQPDYAPGSLVTLTGSNWQPGESVHITVINDDPVQSWSHSADVTADEHGNFADPFSLPAWFAATYTATATGPVSGSATTSFTDGNVSSATIEIRESSCTTAQSSFPGGSTVCAHVVATVTGGGSTTWRIKWFAPGADPATGAPTEDDSFTENAGITQSTRNPTLTVSTEGIWTVVVCKTSSVGSCPKGNQVATASFTVTAPNTTPTVISPRDQTAVAGASQSFSLGSFSDPDNGPWSVDVDWGDGSTHTTFTANAVGSLGTQSHTYSSTGVKSVTVKVTDGQSASGSASFNVTVAAPQAATSLSVSAASGTYGGTANLSAKLTSGGNGVNGKTVSFKLNGTTVATAVTNASGVATLNNISLAGINAGTYLSGVAASFAGDSSFLDSSGSNSLTVNKASATVTLDSLSQTYDGAAKAATSTTSPSGLTVVLSYSQNSQPVATPKNAGSYDVAGAIQDTNYTGSATGTLVIAAKSVTGSFTASDKTYDGTTAATVLTRSVNELISGDDVSLTGGIATFADANVGADKTVTLADAILSGNAAGNYILSSVNTTTASITPATLSVNADNVSTVYGTTPELTYSLTGFVNDENGTTAGVTGTASCSVTDGTPSDVDSYTGAITCTVSTLKAANYTFAQGSAGTLTITALGITVTADNQTKTYGSYDPPFTFSANGLLNGDTLTGIACEVAAPHVNAGPYDITCLGNTNNNYDVTYVNGTLTITPAPLTVTAADANRAYGAANPAFGGTLTGVVNSDNITASYSTAADATSGVGTYAIVPNLSDPDNKLGNYTVSLTDGTLTITPAALAVTANDVSKTYGQDNPDFTVSYKGFVNDDGPTSLGGSLGFDTSASAASGVGTYVVTPKGLTADNYAITFDSGILKIDPATLTVTAEDKTRAYGAANPSFDATITGFVNDETRDTSDVTGSPDCTTTATATSGVAGSPYPITCTQGGLASTNYSFSFVDGALAITPATLTVTADNASKTYGDANPTFTVSYKGFVNNEGESVLSGTLTFATTATPSSDVGSYDVTPSGLTSSNYDITFAKGTLTVTKASLTVTANNKTRDYGDLNPTLDAAITGFVLDQKLDNSGVNGSPNCSTAAIETSPVADSPYTITCAPGSLEADNYDFTFKDGSLTVTPRPITVTADSQTKVYGAADPTFTYKITSGTLVGTDAFSGELSRDTGESVTGNPYAITQGTLALDNNYTLSYAGAILTINPAMLSINAENKTQVYGDASPTPTYKLSGFKFDDTDSVVSGAASCTIADSTGPDVGEYTGAITCAPGDAPDGLSAANYDFETGDSGTLTITPAPLTVTADNASRTYGAANPTFSGTVTGVITGDNITASYSTAADATSGAGTYAIVPSLNDPDRKLGNYMVTSTNGTLTINKAPLTVTAKNATKVYGQNNPAFAVSFDGFVNNEGESVLSGTLAFGTNATAASGVGSYDVTPSGLTSNNYTITFVKGTLKITPATLAVKADDQTMVLGGAVPTLTGSLTGVVNGDNITASYSTSATSASPAGPYAIVPSLNDPDGKLGNYTVTLTNGTLSILYATTTGTCDGSSSRTILPPINADGSSVFKQGSTVPIKFRVCDANGNSIGTPGVVASFQIISSAPNATAIVNESVPSTTPDTWFRWDPTSQQWIFNLSTKSLKSGMLYFFTITLNDGTSFTFKFTTK